MDKFFETIEKYNMFSPGQRVVVGLSGGADSMCLMTLLHRNRERLGITAEAAHVNHCIRGEEALRDESFVREFCDKENITLHVLTADIPAIAESSGESIELCARRIRYEYFDSLGADVIATAHTASDRIETMLMNLTRGASLSGLCSIPPVRSNIVRPLIGFFRSDIEQYCEKENVAFIVDSSNLTDEYTRNKFRNTVIPALNSINPAFEKNALRCIESIIDDEDFLAGATDSTFSRLENADGSIDVSGLMQLDISLQRRVVRCFIENRLRADYEMKHIEIIIRSLGTSFSVVLPGNIRISGTKERLFYDSIKSSEKSDFSSCVVERGDNAVIKNGTDILKFIWTDKYSGSGAGQYAVDAGKLGNFVTVRKRLAGDIFHLGKRRCSKPLKKLYNELKIPPKRREELLVVADDNGLIFAQDVGVDSKYEINNETDKFLIIKTECGKNNE